MVKSWLYVKARAEMKAIFKEREKPGAELREVDIPIIGDQEVLIKVQAVSMCGTDLHIYEWDNWAQRRIKPPLIFGHEFAGEIVKVGSKVTTLKIGDFVSAESHIVCGKCFQCRTGSSHLCQKVTIIGLDRDGCFAEYISLPESCIWKTSRKIPLEVASFQEALGNAVYATLVAEIVAKSVAVFGCGAHGLFTIGIAKAAGAKIVLAIDPNRYRLSLARKMGADMVFDPREVNVVKEILRLTFEAGVDVVIEMSGNPKAIKDGFNVLKKGGRFSVFGIPTVDTSLNFAEDIIFKGATVLGISGRRIFDTWYKMEGLLESGALNIKPVITHRMQFTEFNAAFELLKSGKCGKIVLFL